MTGRLRRSSEERTMIDAERRERRLARNEETAAVVRDRKSTRE